MKVNERRIKRFVTRLLTRVILFAALLIVLLAVIESPIITNEVALGQMDNSSEAFMLLGMYFSVRSLIKTVLWIGVFLFTYTVAYDTYKFIKSIYKEKN